MLKKTIKQLQKVKMNYLHLHLTDDEGWRIEIPALKELTEFGAYRCANAEECLEPQYGSGQSKDSVANGFISAAEYEDLLGFAKVSFKCTGALARPISGKFIQILMSFPEIG